MSRVVACQVYARLVPRQVEPRTPRGAKRCRRVTSPEVAAEALRVLREGGLEHVPQGVDLGDADSVVDHLPLAVGHRATPGDHAEDVPHAGLRRAGEVVDPVVDPILVGEGPGAGAGASQLPGLIRHDPGRPAPRGSWWSSAPRSPLRPRSGGRGTGARGGRRPTAPRAPRRRGPARSDRARRRPPPRRRARAPRAPSPDPSAGAGRARGARGARGAGDGGGAGSEAQRAQPDEREAAQGDEEPARGRDERVTPT